MTKLIVPVLDEKDLARLAQGGHYVVAVKENQPKSRRMSISRRRKCCDHSLEYLCSGMTAEGPLVATA